MIISPPFVPTRAAGQAESAWLDAAMAAPASRMPDTQAPEGSFPLSHALGWHNGMHLQAPEDDGAALRARAVADGTVVFAHVPDVVSTAVDHAQNYNPFDRPGTRTAAWTDNGCVIVEHRTEIGADAGTATEITYYSVYMHLSALGKTTPTGQARRDLQSGDRVWRQDDLGAPGQVYGHRGQIHFEICMDAASLRRLIGRAPNWVEPSVAPAEPAAPTADGRRDAVFGSIYFYLPSGTAVDAGARRPAASLRRNAAGATLGAALWVRMTYDGGACTFETFDARGRRIGALPAEAEVDYDLFTDAGTRDALAGAHGSASGWYELMRFGRNLGRSATDADPLPANAAHWRRIAGADGRAVWADLNAEHSFKFSDADFLPVMGWNCVDDDTTPNDQRCDSAHLLSLVRDPDAANASRMEPVQLVRRLGDDGVRDALRRVICNFPSEWDRANIAARHDFVRQLEPFQASPEAWPRFEAHLQAMSFAGLPPGYLGARWHVHPREFIELMRQCLWLSEREMTQLVPVQVIRGQGGGMRGPFFHERVGRNGGSLLDDHRTVFNLAMRKYGVTTRPRLAALVGNSVQETSWWSTTEEGNGPNLRYAPWYGRGFLQLTNPDGAYSATSNYGRYFRFRGRDAAHASQPQLTQWRAAVALEPFDATDSAGAYWSWCGGNAEADTVAANTRRQITMAPRSQLTPNQAVTIYENVPFRRVACLINLPAAVNNANPMLNGLVDRYTAYANAQVVLFDGPRFPDAQGALQFHPEGYVPRRPPP